MKLIRHMTSIALLVASSILLASEQTIFKAFEDSMHRSMEQLAEQNSVAPYFIAYTLHEDEQIQLNSRLGHLLFENHTTSNSLEVQVRVGSYALDNSNFLDSSTGRNLSSIVTGSVTLNPDYDAIRSRLWLLTDRAYKNAVESFGAKTTALNNNSIDYDVADYQPQEPVVFRDDRKHGELNKSNLLKHANEISEVLRDYGEIYSSNVSVHVDIHKDYYVDTEQTSFTRVDDIAELTVVLNTQAENGAILFDVISDVVRTTDQFTPIDAFKKEVRSAAERLTEMREAPEVETYNGPVLFEGQAAIALVAQVLGSALTAEKNPVRKGRSNRISIASDPRNPFQSKLGARVLPREFYVVNNSTLKTLDGVPLHGTIPIDAEGVKATSTTLIERGMLRNLLTSRQPVNGFSGSTGNKLAGDGPVPTNLIVECSNGLNEEDMLREFQLLVSDRGLEYGYIVKRSAPGVGRPGSQPRSLTINEAYRVYADGTRELVQQARITQFILANFKDIIAGSERTNVETIMGRYFVGPRGSVASNIMSVGTPDLLFEEITIGPAQVVRGKMPILPPPLESG